MNLQNALLDDRFFNNAWRLEKLHFPHDWNIPRNFRRDYESIVLSIVLTRRCSDLLTLLVSVIPKFIPFSTWNSILQRFLNNACTSCATSKNSCNEKRTLWRLHNFHPWNLNSTTCYNTITLPRTIGESFLAISRRHAKFYNTNHTSPNLNR